MQLLVGAVRGGAAPRAPADDQAHGVAVPRELGRAASALRGLRRRAIARLGRPVRCEVCEEELFRGVPLVWGGRLNFFGAEQTLVRVDWDKMNRMTFRHVERDRCGTLRRES